MSDNIFNTEDDREQDIQYAQFVGAQLDARLGKRWLLSSNFDQSWFYFGKAQNRSEDFTSSTVRQVLSYEQSFLEKQLVLNVPLSWELSRIYNRATGDLTLNTWAYGTAVEFSWMSNKRFTPVWGCQYFYIDSGSPTDEVPDKHKVNYDLGVNVQPFKSPAFHITPAVQYSVEQFIGVVRTDRLWTPALTISWQPLKHLAVDAIGNYTRSRSTVEGTSYNVWQGTLLARMFFEW